jgi:hypothetical protein
MSERDVRERDILVASNEFAYVQDLTKGDIVLYVGPTKISLSNTERLVDFKGDRFVPVRGDEGGVGVNAFVSASSSQYIVLENPPKDATVKPLKGSNGTIELLMGRKIVVPGPATFPLWPGQKAKVVGGHELREDEYLVVRVYDRPAIEPELPAIGTEMIVRGSDVSFYIPRTGLEVVPATGGGYVRKAWRLRKNSGLYLRVLEGFVAEADGVLPAGSYAAGQDVFLADREGYFFPSERLEVVGEVPAIPIADKEGIYVRDIATGKISTIAGPRNYLPDPTLVEVVSRTLDERAAALYRSTSSEDRALSVYIPPSFAVMVTAKRKREVVVGPQTRILDFDEDLEVLELSTGTPKSDERVLETCFLQVEGNKVSDVVRMKTGDHVELEVALSYRVSFTTKNGEPERWFHVKNYVGLLCDHLASLVRSAARTTSIDAFHSTGVELLRTAILGEKEPDRPRPGRTFDENGMWVYDVEILDVRILDADVKKLLADAQKTAIVAEIQRRKEEMRLASERLRESVDRAVLESQIATLAKQGEHEIERSKLAAARADAGIQLDKIDKLGKAKNDAEAFEIASAARIAAKEREAVLEERGRDARVRAFKEQMSAMAPELVATLKTLGNQEMAMALSKSVSPLAILGGESVAEVVARLVGSLPVGAQGERVRDVLAGFTSPVASVSKGGEAE